MSRAQGSECESSGSSERARQATGAEARTTCVQVHAERGRGRRGSGYWIAHQLVEHVADGLVGARAAHERRRLRVLDELRLAARDEAAAGLRLRLAALTQLDTRTLVRVLNSTHEEHY